MEKKRKKKRLVISLWILGGLITVWTPICIISNSIDTYLESPDPKPEVFTEPVNNDLLRLCTFIPPEGTDELLGMIVLFDERERILPLEAAYASMTGHTPDSFSGMLNFILEKEKNVKLAREIISFYRNNPNMVATYTPDAVKFLPPIKQPLKVVDCGAFWGHDRNMAHAIMKKHIPGFIYNGIIVPLNWLSGTDALFIGEKDQVVGYFVGNNLGIYGSGESVVIAQNVEQIDIEPEIAVVISQNGKNIDKSRVKDYIAGFMLYNDFTDRKIQEYEFVKTHYGYVKSKVINSMGPYLVMDLDIRRVTIRTVINGIELPICSTFDMLWTLEDVISYVSSMGEGVAAGQVIGLGTLTGGSLFERGLPELKAGDTIELIGNQGLGSLKNNISY